MYFEFLVSFQCHRYPSSVYLLGWSAASLASWYFPTQYNEATVYSVHFDQYSSPVGLAASETLHPGMYHTVVSAQYFLTCCFSWRDSCDFKWNEKSWSRVPFSVKSAYTWVHRLSAKPRCEFQECVFVFGVMSLTAERALASSTDCSAQTL